MFDHIIGNEKAKQYLTSIVSKSTIGSSFLFSGQDGIGKSLFAEAFAKLVICQEDASHLRKLEASLHPDMHVYKPEGKIGMHSIAAMRQFSEEVNLAPSEATWKAFIIHDADRMLSYSANALLKTFEEPPPNTLIILLSSNPISILPTVLSRCRKIRFQSLSESEIENYLINRKGMTELESKAIAEMSEGSIGQALKYATVGGCPLRKYILDCLVIGKFTSYKELTSAAKKIAEVIEEKKKGIEAQVRSLFQGSYKDLSQIQKLNLEKEVEGAVMTRTVQEAKSLFFIVLAWYRDMHLYSVNGNHKLLIHQDYKNESLQAFERGLILPIENIQKSINEVTLSLERSTSIAICFENLLLKLGMI